jgi:hypothetical protein
LRRPVFYSILLVIFFISCQKNQKPLSEVQSSDLTHEQRTEGVVPLKLYDISAERQKYKEYIEQSGDDSYSFIWNEGRDWLSARFESGVDYHVLDGPVNVRLEPHLDGRILGQLKLHERIQIIGSALYLQKINNILAGWYPVKYGDGLAYVWAGNIAGSSLVYDLDGNGVNDYFYTRVIGEASSTGIIDTWVDFYIYINNKKIQRKDLMGGGRICHFILDGTKVILNFYDPESSYEISLNEKGELQFIRDHFLDRLNEFLFGGHCFFNADGRWEMYLEDLEEPVQRIEGDNGSGITLVYKDWVVKGGVSNHRNFYIYSIE